MQVPADLDIVTAVCKKNLLVGPNGSPEFL